MSPLSPNSADGRVAEEELAVLEFLSTFSTVRKGAARGGGRGGEDHDDDEDDDDDEGGDRVSSSSSALRSFVDLSDGVALYESLVDIDPSQFDALSSIARDVGDNWALKAGNWRRVVRSLHDYYHRNAKKRVDALSQLLHDPNVAAGLAKNQRPDDLWTLVELVAAAAVTCPRKSDYVGKLLALSPESQSNLKTVLQRGLARLEELDAVEGDDSEFDPDTSADDRDVTGDGDDNDEENELVFGSGYDPTSSSQGGVDASLLLFPDDGANATALKQELETLQSQHALEKEDWNRASERLQSVVDDLQDRLVRRQEELIAVEEDLSRTQSHLEDVQSQLAQAMQDKSQLADDLDLAQAKAAQLHRAEATLAAYKKRLESQGSASAATKDLEDQAALYIRQIADLEVQAKKAKDLARTVSDLQDNVGRLERERDDLKASNAALLAQSDSLQSQLQSAERSRKLFEDEATELRAQAEANESAASSMPPSPRGASPPDAEVMQRLRFLEAENRQLRELSSSGAAESAAAMGAAAVASDDAAALRDEVHRLRTELEAKSQENAKISSDKDKLEAYTKRTLAKFQDKYLVALQECKTKLKEKQDKIEALESRSASERTAQKREERLLSSTIYELGLAIMQNRLKER